MEIATARQSDEFSTPIVVPAKKPELTLALDPIEAKMLKDQAELEALKIWEEKITLEINAEVARISAIVNANKDF